MIRFAASMLALVMAAAPVRAATPFDAMVAPAAYAELLKRHVVRHDLPDGGFETRFDYAGLLRDPDQAATRATLRETFEAVEPEALGRDARYAWAANAYNFFVIDAVCEALAADSTLASVADIGKGNFAVFDAPRIRIGGETVSLNAFERRWLFLDVDRPTGTIPEGLDPRFHFAIVCAAWGCPPLQPAPFTAAGLSDALDAAVRNAFLTPRQFRAGDDTVHLSQIFSWYAVDFGGEAGMRAFVARYAPAATAPRIADGTMRLTADISWDWTLNRP